MEEPTPQLRHQLSQYQQVQQQAQALMMQKQQLEMASHETDRALEEIEKLKEGDTVYKSVGGILAKSDRADVEKELKERKETLDLRIKTLERQESRAVKRMNEMRDKIQGALKGEEPPAEA